MGYILARATAIDKSAESELMGDERSDSEEAPDT